MMIAYSMKVSRAHVGRRSPERLALRPDWKVLKMHDRSLICVVKLENVFQLESEQQRRAHHRRFRQGIIDQSCRIGNVVLQLSRKLCEANFLAARPMFRRSSNVARVIRTSASADAENRALVELSRSPGIASYLFAHAFWRSAIGIYTSGHFDEQLVQQFQRAPGTTIFRTAVLEPAE